MHGLGFGLAQYMLSVLLFMEYAPKDQPIMIPLQPHISQAILHPFHMTPLSRDHWVRALRGLFKKLRWDEEGVTMVSHSKGSLLHTWLLKAHPELIQRSCFIDPGKLSAVTRYRQLNADVMLQSASAFGKAICATTSCIASQLM